MSSALQALDSEYGAVCSQLGEAFLALESAQARVAKLKAQREDVIVRYQAAKKAAEEEAKSFAERAADVD